MKCSLGSRPKARGRSTQARPRVPRDPARRERELRDPSVERPEAQSRLPGTPDRYTADARGAGTSGVRSPLNPAGREPASVGLWKPGPPSGPSTDLGVPPSPLVQQRFPGPATERATARTKPPSASSRPISRALARSRPSPRSQGLLRASKPPPGRPLPARVHAAASSSRERFPRLPSPALLPPTPLASARARKEEGALGDGTADAIILCFSAAPTSTSGLRPTGFGPEVTGVSGI